MWVGSGQAGSGSVRLGWVGIAFNLEDRIQSAGLDQVGLGWVGSGQAGLGRARLG